MRRITKKASSKIKGNILGQGHGGTKIGNRDIEGPSKEPQEEGDGHRGGAEH